MYDKNSNRNHKYYYDIGMRACENTKEGVLD
jgi:hypothetical protein